jgi:hypothetical protein
MSGRAVRARLYPDDGGSAPWLPLRRLDWDKIKVSRARGTRQVAYSE